MDLRAAISALWWLGWVLVLLGGCGLWGPLLSNPTALLAGGTAFLLFAAALFVVYCRDAD